MEINFHLRSLDAVGPAHASKASHRATQAAQDEVAFENSRALTTALQNTPESREDVVRRATELVGDVNYPPPETIRMISNLLAIQMRTETGSDS
jgi:hypothetical protein